MKPLINGKNYYDFLGVEKEATAQKIQEAYQRKMEADPDNKDYIKQLKEVKDALDNHRDQYNKILENSQVEKNNGREFKSIIAIQNQDHPLLKENETPLKNFDCFEKGYKNDEKFTAFKEFAEKKLEEYRIFDLDNGLKQVMKYAEERAKDTGDLSFVAEALEKRKKDFQDDLEGYQKSLLKRFEHDMKNENHSREDTAKFKSSINQAFEEQKNTLNSFLDEQINFVKKDEVKKELSSALVSDYEDKIKSGKPFLIGDEPGKKPIEVSQNEDGSYHIDYPKAKQHKQSDNFWANMPGMQPKKPAVIDSKKQLKEYQAMFAAMKKQGKDNVFIRTNNKDSRALIYAAALRAGYDPDNIQVEKYRADRNGKVISPKLGSALTEKEKKYLDKKAEEYVKKMEKIGLDEMDKSIDESSKNSANIGGEVNENDEPVVDKDNDREDELDVNENERQGLGMK